MMRDHSKVVKAIERFLKVLAESNIDEDAIIDKTELKLAFSDVSLCYMTTLIYHLVIE